MFGDKPSAEELLEDRRKEAEMRLECRRTGRSMDHAELPAMTLQEALRAMKAPEGDSVRV